MKLDNLITLLQEKRKLFGGDIETVISYNGCHNSGDLMDITEILENGAFIAKELDEEELLFTSDFNPFETDKIQKFLTIYSDRADFQFNGLTE